MPNEDDEKVGEARVVRSNYGSNSHKSRDKAAKPEKPKVEKLISGEAIQKKKSLGSRISDTFRGDDAKGVGNYIIFEVILPAAKATISDAVSQGIERLLFGEQAKSRSRSNIRGSNYTAYNRSYPGRSTDTRDERGNRSISNRGRSTHNFSEITLADRGEAESVLDALSDLIDQFDVASVADLYSLVGITGAFTDNKWGWYDLKGADISRVRDGYLLQLPPTEEIE